MIAAIVDDHLSVVKRRNPRSRFSVSYPKPCGLPVTQRIIGVGSGTRSRSEQLSLDVNMAAL